MRSGWIAIVIAAGASLLAADQVKVWSSADLKALEQKMSARKEKVETAPLAVYSNYQMSVAHRTASGEAELHETTNDIFYVLSGTATLVTAGTISGQRTTAPHEIRGASITGGEQRKIGPGDWLTIPAGVPHQLLLDPGTEFTYAVVKVTGK
jgi:mannose-6-phosphate isomerase-like protein (cupin superfamily)